MFLLGSVDKHTLQALVALLFTFAAVGLIWFLAYFVYGMVIITRRAETKKVTLELLKFIFEGLKTIFALIWLGGYCLFQLSVWLIIAGVAITAVVGVVFLIIKGIKFVWYY